MANFNAYPLPSFPLSGTEQIVLAQNGNTCTAPISAIQVTGGGVGPTPNRPVSPAVGTQYFDTTLGYPIWWAGTQWINGTGYGPV
jgi:hypothetical protein